MAKIKMGAFMTDISGSTGGSTFAKNRGGLYVRRKSTVSNPQTVAQMLVRSAFALFSRAWSGLTDLQRQGWNAGVSNFKSTDVFGDVRTPSGKALFQKLNQNLSTVGQPQLDECPVPQDVPSLDIISATYDVSDGTLTLVGGNDVTDSFAVVSATPKLSAGKSFVKNDLRQILTEADAVTPASVVTNYVAKFGTPAVNDNIYLGFKSINAIGQASPMSVIKLEIVA